MTNPNEPQTIVPPNLLKARVAPKLGVLTADALAKAEAALKAACEKLLANLVVENYKIELLA